MSLSRSNSREHLGSGSESDNWRDRNGIGPGSHSEFAASIGSPKRKQNKSSELCVLCTLLGIPRLECVYLGRSITVASLTSSAWCNSHGISSVKPSSFLPVKQERFSPLTPFCACFHSSTCRT